jgi:hypothetical protein
MLYPPELRARYENGNNLPASRAIIKATMEHSTYIAAALASVPTIITVLIGILLNNGRFTDLNSRMTAFEGRMNSFEGRMQSFDSRLTGIDNKLDMRFDVLIGKVDDIDNRLTRLESQRH